MSMLHIPIVHTHDVSKQIPQEKNSLCDFLFWDFTIKKLVETYMFLNIYTIKVCLKYSFVLIM